MIVRFTSSTSGEMIMFAEHARRLFDLIGKEGSARGVFTAEQLPAAIEKLQLALAQARQETKRAEKDEPDGGKDDQHDDDGKKTVDTVSLVQRATPLLHLLERTSKEGGFITWEAAQDF